MIVLETAVLQDPQAMRQIGSLTKEMALHLFSVSARVLGYIPNTLGISVEDIRWSIIDTLSGENVNEVYIRELINNTSIGGRQSKWPIDVLALIDTYGTRDVKKIAVDEYLIY